MSKDVDNLIKKFIANGGTEEEFWAERRKILASANARKEKYEADYKAAEQKEINDLVKKGYTTSEAQNKVSADNIKAEENRGFGKSNRAKLDRIPNVGLTINAKNQRH